MVVEDLEGQRFESGIHRSALGEDLYAVALVLDHALDPPDQALDAMQELDQRRLVGDMALGLLFHLAHAVTAVSSVAKLTAAFNALELVQLAFDVRSAGGASHALQLESDTLARLRDP
jgi:hypothetical protein